MPPIFGPRGYKLSILLAISIGLYIIAVILYMSAGSTWEPNGYMPEINEDVEIYLDSVGPCHDNGKGVRLLILILSDVLNFRSREQIRNTYASQWHLQGCAVRHVFLLARIYAVKEQEMVAAEAHRHNDIVQFNFHVNYRTLVNKTVGGLSWAHRFCKDAEYVLKTDDDVLVFPRTILRMLTGLSPDQKRDLYTGRLQTGSRPNRFWKSKWFVSMEEYPYSYYPPFVWGMGVLMSKNVCNLFYLASKRVPRVHNEDVYLGLLARYSNINPTCNTALYINLKKDNLTMDFCAFRDTMLVLVQRYNRENLWKNYQEKLAGNLICCVAAVARSTHCTWSWTVGTAALTFPETPCIMTSYKDLNTS